MDPRLERILPRVQKPSRYTGGEYNETIKDKSRVDLRFAFCFPDTYEIGMSNLGMRILYGCLNEMEGVWCERVFAPWGDMEDEMRRANIPLYALESGDPVGEFDVIAFSLGYEMAYTEVLNMLDLAGLPVRSSERPDLTPLVVAGGTSCINAEPLADFVDLFLIGEGEELDPEVCLLLRRARDEGWSKGEFLRKAARIPGVYVPGLYDIAYNPDGTVAAISPRDGAPKKVTKRIIQNLDGAYFPTKTIIPSTEIIHDRVVLELFRGCIRGCRFCQAGYAYRPVRRRSPQKCLELAKEALTDSGYEEITLSSLSSSDYKGLGELCDGLLDFCEPRMISLSLPSLRADNFSMSLMDRVQKVRKTGLTFAPEAGSQRLRDVINKNVTEEDLMRTCSVAFSGGWSTIKLYFMLGLPTETDEDVLAIADLAHRVQECWYRNTNNRARGVRITVSTALFVPKPHTPFQWEPQISSAEYERRVYLLKDRLKENKSRSVTYNYHNTDISLVEAVLSRGDRRLGPVIEEVWRQGGRLEAWSEYFSLERWEKALEKFGLSADFYAFRKRGEDEVFPWDMIDLGVEKDYLASERKEAYNERITPDCRKMCTGCGASCLLEAGFCDE
ncbi:MAG: TIGR03960 family B12-binding radical SAM protein [Oscillospiraceae bacterium]|nr:TIGR03960 family B12-binding radical SAM protein [Oscillospiraceae bacterium]